MDYGANGKNKGLINPLGIGVQRQEKGPESPRDALVQDPPLEGD